MGMHGKCLRWKVFGHRCRPLFDLRRTEVQVSWQLSVCACSGKSFGMGRSKALQPPERDIFKMEFRRPISKGCCHSFFLFQDYCEDDGAGSFRILVAKEGCSFTGETCTRRITVLFDGGEIELHGREVSLPPPSLSPQAHVLKRGF